MGKLDVLREQFDPRRTFQGKHTTIEVDGVFARVPEDNDRERSLIPLMLKKKEKEDEKDSWVRFQTDPGGGDLQHPSHFAIDTEDILQDPAVIRSARVSTGRDSDEVNEKADGLVNFLWRDRHVTPFEGGVHFRFRNNMPIMFAEPFFNLFASHNEWSGRYSVIDGAYYTPENLRQEVLAEFISAEREAQELYKELLGMSVAKEMARFVHLYRFFTEFYMTISLRHVLDFFTYDLGYHPIGRDPDFAEIPGLLKKVIASWAPWAYQAYLKHPRHQNNQWVIDSIKNFTAKHRKELFDNICNSTHSVLDKGSISLIDFHGNDSAAIACLEAFPNPLKAFDLWTMTFAIEMPIPVYRQWVRHRHGTMVKLIVDYDRIVRERLFYIPERFRTQKGKVGSYIYEDMSDGENEIVRDKFRRHIEMACARYERLRSMGVVSDVAALNLPYTFYVPVIWHAPLGGIFNFLSLRTDSHAQWEMKEYAHPVWEEVKTHFDKSADLFVRNLYYGDSSKVRNS